MKTLCKCLIVLLYMSWISCQDVDVETTTDLMSIKAEAAPDLEPIVAPSIVPKLMEQPNPEPQSSSQAAGWNQPPSSTGVQKPLQQQQQPGANPKPQQQQQHHSFQRPKPSQYPSWPWLPPSSTAPQNQAPQALTISIPIYASVFYPPNFAYDPRNNFGKHIPPKRKPEAQNLSMAALQSN